MIRSRRAVAVAGVLVGLLLAGCTAPGPPAAAPEYPFRSSGPQVALRWRITRSDQVVRADGVAARRVEALRWASLQLTGLDAAGTIQSYSTPGPVRWSSAWDEEPFALALRPRGSETRFEVRVLAWSYEGARGSGAGR